MDYIFTKSSGIPIPEIPDVAFKLPWAVLIEQGNKLANLIWRQFQKRGLYEVLEYESTLELLDTTGQLSRFSKRQK
jgi:hypothetical protein